MDRIARAVGDGVKSQEARPHSLRLKPWAGSRRKGPVNAEPTRNPEESTAGSSHLTDTGNAERFARLYRERLRHCHAFGAWFFYNGHVWRQDRTGEVMRLAKAAVATIY